MVLRAGTQETEEQEEAAELDQAVAQMGKAEQTVVSGTGGQCGDSTGGSVGEGGRGGDAKTKYIITDRGYRSW